MNRSSRMMGAAVTALALAGAAACSSTSSTGTPAASGSGSISSTPSGTGGAPSAAAAAITISSFAFGSPLTVAPGASITVTNKDSVAHTVTADSSGGFDVSVPAGGTATFTAPTKAGSYPFHCSIHPNMHGTLIVSASGSSGTGSGSTPSSTSTGTKY